MIKNDKDKKKKGEIYQFEKQKLWAGKFRIMTLKRADSNHEESRFKSFCGKKVVSKVVKYVGVSLVCLLLKSSKYQK